MSHQYSASKSLTRIVSVDATTGYIDSALIAPVAPSGGSATTVEVDLGATASFAGKFTITDAGITAAKKVLCWQSPGPYTGKGTRADEAEMQPVQVIAVEPAAGSAVVRWQTPPIVVNQPFPGGSGLAGLGTIVPGLKDPQGIARSVARRLGRARGNFKFSYMVLS